MPVLTRESNVRCISWIYISTNCHQKLWRMTSFTSVLSMMFQIILLLLGTVWLLWENTRLMIKWRKCVIWPAYQEIKPTTAWEQQERHICTRAAFLKSSSRKEQGTVHLKPCDRMRGQMQVNIRLYPQSFQLLNNKCTATPLRLVLCFTACNLALNHLTVYPEYPFGTCMDALLTFITNPSHLVPLTWHNHSS